MIDDSFGHWLAGFIDGEGCFNIQRHHTKSCPFSMRFSICVRLDDLAIIEEIRERAGFGLISLRRYPTILGNHQAEWKVQRKADCALLVELLDRYPLRAKKSRDYALWREAVRIWVAGGVKAELRTSAQVERLEQLHGEIRAVRVYRPPLAQLEMPRA